MHELSLCNSIYKIVDRAAEGRPVSVIHLQVGRLRQVVPDTLRYCWTLVSEETPLSGSTLAVESIPGALSCADCAHQTTVEHDLILVCAGCGSAAVQVVAGEEFFLTSLELAEA